MNAASTSIFAPTSTHATLTAAPAPATPWARHLAGAACIEPHGDGEPGEFTGLPPGTAPQLRATLSMAEAQRVQRYHDRLMAAVQSQDRGALRSAKQEVLQAAFRSGTGGGPPCAGSPAMRRALRDLCWRMAILMLPRQREG